MTTGKRVALFSVATVVLIVVLAVAGLLLVRQVRYGAIVEPDTARVTVRVGDRFSLKVPDRGASVGDHWTATVQPDGMLRSAGDELVSASPIEWVSGPMLGGSAGSRYFRFDAVRTGQVTVTLSNCFQGCDNERTRAESSTLTWTVTVS